MEKGIGVYFLLVVMACGLCRADNLVGEKSPEIKIKGWVTENPPDLRGLEGKVLVLDFWATWCGPCVSNIPELILLCSKYKPKGVEFIALSQDKSSDKVKKLVREKGMNYHVAIDNGSADLFKIMGYPTAVIINHTGKVIWVGFPWEPGFEKTIADAVTKVPH